MQELSQACSQFHDPCSATSFVEVIAFDQSENLSSYFFPTFFYPPFSPAVCRESTAETNAKLLAPSKCCS